jgi:hypothetical protein
MTTHWTESLRTGRYRLRVRDREGPPSSHFPLMPYSNAVNPVALPPGCARLATNPTTRDPTEADARREYERRRGGARRKAMLS